MEKPLIYYHRGTGFSFYVKKLDENNRPVRKLNEFGDKMNEYDEVLYQFQKSASRKINGEKIDTCYYTVTEDTPAEVKAYLKKEHAKGVIKLELEFEKEINPARAEAIIMVEKVNAEKAALSDKLTSTTALMEKMQKEMDDMKKRMGNR